MIDEKKFNILRGIVMASYLPNEEKREMLGFLTELSEQPQADKWIPCEVEMPKEEMEVWVTHENGKVLRHYWFNGEFVQNYPLDEPRPYPKAIAWMPCIKPQPYKKEGAE